MTGDGVFYLLRVVFRRRTVHSLSLVEGMSHGDVSTLDAFFGSPRVAVGCNVHGVVDHGNVSSPSVTLFVPIDNTFDRN